MTPEQDALFRLGQLLWRYNYHFVTVTPDTHRRVNARATRASQPAPPEPSLRDVFGWNRCFSEHALPADVLALVREAGALESNGELLRSRVRFSTLGEQLFVHSSFPTVAADAVFFGPDTYRFCALLRRWAPPSRRAIDLGCGSGAGAITLAQRVDACVLTDINPRALQFAEVNARFARFEPTLVRGDLFGDVPGLFDLIIANPPYMRDELARTYRDGGGDYGESLGARIVRESLPRLNPGGTLIVYTGAAIVAGRDTFRAAIAPMLRDRARGVQYEELDPDVFGDELEQPAYTNVERIAAVGLKVCDS
jgi:methylase of polypeptide subunit release factors